MNEFGQEKTMNEEFWDDLKQSIDGRCAWNNAGNCCRGIEEAYKAGAAAGYANGVAVMKERCAEVADKHYMIAMCDLSEDWFEYSADIAATIRGVEI